MDIESLRFSVEDLREITDHAISAEMIESWTRALSNSAEVWQVPVGDDGYGFWHLMEAALRAKIMGYRHSDAVAGMIVRRRAAQQYVERPPHAGFTWEDSERGFPILPELQDEGRGLTSWHWQIKTNAHVKAPGEELAIRLVRANASHTEIEDAMDPDSDGIMFLNVSPVVHRVHDYVKRREGTQF